MIKLNRSMSNKWIFQKNISGTEILIEYVKALKQEIFVDYEILKDNLKRKSLYKGRSNQGSTSTFGVRLSQISFYMFGFKKNNKFIPSPMAINLTNELNNKSEIAKNTLINLFSIQFPHPNSDTPDNFEINAGRLIVKLLLEPKLQKRLYMDEFAWFVPFLEKMDELIYKDLVSNILEFRKLNFLQKLDLFKSAKDYERLFANIFHEFNYYFLRIFHDFGVLSKFVDNDHNGGKIFKFKHSEKTFRNDSIAKKQLTTGYFCLNSDLHELAERLLNKFSVFDKPLTTRDENLTKSDLQKQLYEIRPIAYLAEVFEKSDKERQILDIINYMVEMSVKPNTDGKEFELSVVNIFKMFGDIIKIDHISGAGDTDISCIGDFDSQNFKFVVETKARSSINGLNVTRIERHIEKNGSKYCIVVAPRFPNAVIQDVMNKNVALITADSLANFCSKEILLNRTSYINFYRLHNLIIENLGKEISEEVNTLYSTSI